MEPEITEENDDEVSSWITDFQKEKIRKIIEYQKSLYLSSASSSSSYSSAAASCSSSSFSSCRGSRSSLLELMKGGSTSLRRLFDMEHTSLATYFDNYSGSPITKPVPLWGSDSDSEHYDPWASIKQIGFTGNSYHDEQSNFASDGSRRNGDQYNFKHTKVKIHNRKLKRKKSFRRLPGFGLWRFRGFRFFRLRLRRLRFMICGRKSLKLAL